MTYTYLLIDDDADGVRVITLNRPDKLNSWNSQMRAELRDAVESTASVPDVRALMITGAGAAFSAGEDVGGMNELSDVGTRTFRAVVRRIHSVFDVVENLEVPVIAAINGVAAGGGLELALSCDFRVMADTARLVMPEVKVGLIPGSGGCSRLVKHVGLGRAKELVMLAETVHAPLARELGLVTRVVPHGQALKEARSLADQLSRHAPLALGMAKVVLNTCTDVDAETGRRLERLGQSVLKATEDHREGVAAFAAKRPPNWRAR